MPGVDDDDGFGETWVGEGTQGDGDPGDDPIGGDGGIDPGSPPCVAQVESLTLLDDTRPESISCVEVVYGDLTIGPTTGLVDLSVLSKLREVGGTLYVFGNAGLASLHGLESLTDVDHLHVRRNHGLADLDGLDSLAGVEVITIANNEGLTSIAGLPLGLAPALLEIGDNDLLTNLDGLPPFGAPSPDAIHIEIEGNPSLVDLAGLSDCCADQRASILLARNDSLVDLSGLEGFFRLASLQLHGNHALASVDGLTNLIELDTLDVDYDQCAPGYEAKLVDFSGFSQLLNLDVLSVQWAAGLTSFAGLEQVVSLSKLIVRNNASLSWVDVGVLVDQTGPLLVDACGGIGGPECAVEPCPMF